MEDNTLEHYTIEHNTVECNIIHKNTIKWNKIQWNTIQWNTIQWIEYEISQCSPVHHRNASEYKGVLRDLGSLKYCKFFKVLPISLYFVFQRTVYC